MATTTKNSNIQYHWVLGATGYVGRAVVRELLERFGSDPGVQIVAVGHQKIDPEVMERTHFLMMPLGKIEQQWLERFPPAFVYHCARMAGGKDWRRKRAARRGERANVRLKGMLEELATPPTLVYCSGTLMYGNHEEAVAEHTPEQPIAYARAYERAERPWKAGSSKMDIRIAYPAWILGPDSWFEAFYLKPAVEQKFVPQVGDGLAWMQVVHVQDVAGQLVHAALEGRGSEHYNIYGGEAIRQGEFAAAVAEELGVDVEVVDEAELVQRYGKTVTEALTSSIPLTTIHPEWKSAYVLKHAPWRAMVRSVVQACFRKS